MMAESNRFLLALLLGTIYVCLSGPIPTCPQGATFPNWMMGDFHAIFADGTSANGSFGLRYANVSFSTGEKGILTMTEPLLPGPGFYTFHECVQIQDTEPAMRCSLLVPNPDGYTEYIHQDPNLVPICPKSLDDPGLEIETVKRMKSNRIKVF